jgi:hypothetical protein
VNDYYEDKMLAEIAEKSLETGEFVNELADPNASSTAAPATATCRKWPPLAAGHLPRGCAGDTLWPAQLEPIQ